MLCGFDILRVICVHSLQYTPVLGLKLDHLYGLICSNVFVHHCILFRFRSGDLLLYRLPKPLESSHLCWFQCDA